MENKPEEKKPLYNFDPEFLNEDLITKVIKDERMLPSYKITGRHGNRGVVSKIINDDTVTLEKITLKDVELIPPAISIFNRIGYELEIMNILYTGEPGYFHVTRIGDNFFNDSIWFNMVTRKKSNTRKERRILRRSKQALGLKRVNKVVYTWWKPRVYCVEGN